MSCLLFIHSSLSLRIFHVLSNQSACIHQQVEVLGEILFMMDFEENDSPLMQPSTAILRGNENMSNYLKLKKESCPIEEKQIKCDKNVEEECRKGMLNFMISKTCNDSRCSEEDITVKGSSSMDVSFRTDIKNDECFIISASAGNKGRRKLNFGGWEKDLSSQHNMRNVCKNWPRPGPSLECRPNIKQEICDAVPESLTKSEICTDYIMEKECEDDEGCSLSPNVKAFSAPNEGSDIIANLSEDIKVKDERDGVESKCPLNGCGEDMKENVDIVLDIVQTDSDNLDLVKTEFPEIQPKVEETFLDSCDAFELQSDDYLPSEVSEDDPSDEDYVPIQQKKKISTKSRKQFTGKNLHVPTMGNPEKSRPYHRSSETTDYPCDKCDKRYSSMRALRGHIIAQHTDLGVTCDVCGKRFAFPNILEIHLRVHTNERPYACTVCGARYKQATDLKNHLQIHSGEKPHECPICGKYFTRHGAISRHILIHTGEKPFRCPVCGKGFNLKSSRKSHMRTHGIGKGKSSNPDDPRFQRFQCSYCPTSFTTNSNRNKHEHNLHSTGENKYSCAECSLTFRNKQDLKRHAGSHRDKLHPTDTGNAFTCKICGKNFSRKQTLQNHEARCCKNCRCELCGKVFPDWDKLTSHLQDHEESKEQDCSSRNMAEILQSPKTEEAYEVKNKSTYESTEKVIHQHEEMTGNTASAEIQISGAAIVPANVHLMSTMNKALVLNEEEEDWSCPICNKPWAYEEGDFMIGCDDCDKWYHWTCVGITEAPPEDQQWLCPPCQILNVKKKYKRKRKHKMSQSKLQ